VQRFESDPVPVVREDDILERLDGALRAATRERCSPADANLFSGGVDSTLLQHYLGAAVPAVTVTIDSPEFEPERRYAAAARRLLGAQGYEVAYEESEYLTRLHETIGALRLPPHHLQSVTIDAAFRSPHKCYFTAQFADALFGLGYAGHAQRAWQLRAAAALPIGRLLPGPAGRKFRTLQNTVAALRRSAGSPNSFAQRFAVYSDAAALASIFGLEALEGRLQSRVDYTQARLSENLAARGPGIAANLQLGHWLDFLCDDTVALWGGLALSRGKRLLAPFTDPAVVRASTAIPVAVRYARHGVAKHWPKRLLQREVPAYPVSQPKYSSGLPFGRFYESGPLAHALCSYARPSFLPPAVWNDLDRQPTWLTWNVLTYLIWDETVRRRTQSATKATAVLRFAELDPVDSPHSRD
jgi:asparagine synthase (glutamine-hydrolysing)